MFKRQVKRAFTLIEILIVVVILGILAAIVIPQFTDASTDASDEAMRSSLVSQLQTIRGQHELFKVQFPDAAAAWDPSAIAAATQWDAMVDRNYLQAPPVNPFTNSSEVVGAAAANQGWVFRAKSGTNPTKTFYGITKAGSEFDPLVH